MRDSAEGVRPAAQRGEGRRVGTRRGDGRAVQAWAILISLGSGALAEDARGKGFQWRVYVTLDGQPLLHEMTVTARHGRLLGVLGPSGSGKTTLLHAIAGAVPSSTRVWLEGASSEGAPIVGDGSVALLKQDDGFFGMLTVRETLAVAAELQPERPPTDGQPRAPVQRAARVEETLRALGLEAVAGARVGDRSHRGISGGELRRLSVGCALLGDPQLLIADEPTSGLDSHQAERVVVLLRELATERAIPAVATLHQPKSSIFHSLDDLLLMAPGGRVAYHGPTAKALDYFRALGHRCPPQTNPAEFLIDLVSMDHDSERGGDVARRRIDGIVQRYSAMARGGRATGAASPADRLAGFGVSLPIASVGPDAPMGGPSEHRRLRPVRAMRSAVTAAFRAARRLLPVGAGSAGAARRTARRAPLLRRVRTLMLRAWRQNVRDVSTNGLRLGACVTLALLFGDMFGKLGLPSAASVSSRVELLSYASIVMSMMALMKTLDALGREQRALERERSRRQYGSLEYLLAKMVAELPFDALFAGGFGALLHRKVGLRMPAKMLAGTLALNAACCSALGLAIGSITNRPEASLVLGVPVCVVHMVVGVISPAGASKKPPSAAMRAVALTSPIKWVIRSVMCSELRGMQLVRSTLSGGPRMGGLALVRSGDQVLERLGLQDETAAHASARLGMLTGAYLLAALVGQQLARPHFQTLKSGLGLERQSALST